MPAAALASAGEFTTWIRPPHLGTVRAPRSFSCMNEVRA